VAAIVASRLDMPALTFSAPGIMNSYIKFGITDTNLIRKNVVGVRPSGDIIPKIDLVAGVINDIECDASIVTCHLLRRTACQLLTSCGDPLNRSFRYCIDPDY